MSESTRPPMQSVQRSLLVGVLTGLVFGAIIGIIMATIYVQQNPPVYQGGAYPSELTNAYQKHYMAMVVDSYIVNQDPKVAAERLKTFKNSDSILVLGERSAAYVAAERGGEAQLINNLAVALKGSEGWNDTTIEAVVSDLTKKYETDPARSQAIGSYSAALLEGQVPVTPEAAQEGGLPEITQTKTGQSGGEWQSWLTYLACCLLLLGLILVLYVIGKRRFENRRLPTKQEFDWEGEGPAPLKVWKGTYTLGQDNYDEFFTVETDDNVFLGECGMGILEALPDTSPKQVVAFDVGLFDKTDITTLSRAVMSEHAYNDQALRSKVEANPQAEPVLAEPGKEFSFETSALRVDARIVEMEYAEGGNVYFDKLRVELNLFVKEGADLKEGEMDIPDQYK